MQMRKTGAMLGISALLLALLVGQPGIGQMQGPMPMEMSSSPQMNPQMLEKEIELLIAINRMGLSVEQLQQLQQIVSELRAPQQMHLQHRQELRDFLLSWQGSPEEFESALQSFQEEKKQELQQLKAQQKELIAQLKDVLTYRQGELLRQALQKLSAPKGMGMGGMGRMERPEGPAHGAAPGQQQMGMGMMGMGQGHGQGQGQGQAQAHAQAQAQPGMGMGMGMMQMMQQHMQMMRQMMGRMGQNGMGMGRMGGAQAPKLEELILKHAELLERVLGQKLQALQGQ